MPLGYLCARGTVENDHATRGILGVWIRGDVNIDDAAEMLKQCPEITTGKTRGEIHDRHLTRIRQRTVRHSRRCALR